MINKEDYEEPRCVLCMDKKEVKPIPISRVLQKLDEYFNENDYDGAEKHLKYWLDEAYSGNDLRGQSTIYNELMGLYRKVGNKDDAIHSAEMAINTLEALGQTDSLSYATVALNVGTVYKAFNLAQRALPLYEKSKEIYERLLSENDSRLAGLYNNMGLCLIDLNNFSLAKQLFDKAITILDKDDNRLDKAITYLNLCMLVEKEIGLENGEKQIEEYVEKAWNEIDIPNNLWSGYYAFVCEKCASGFGYYGYFSYQAVLEKRAEEIYEGFRTK